MESSKYISELEKLPGESSEYSLDELLGKSKALKSNIGVIEGAIAAEIGLEYVFDTYNVDDTIQEAYGLAYNRLAEQKTLYEKALEENSEGIDGLISGIKGKLFEINLEGQLENQFPGFDFTISENPTQPIWDLQGVGPDGQEILVQAKMGAAEYASEVKERMLDNPDVLFATSTEIQEKILEESPELADQFIDINVSNMELTEGVQSGLDQLLDNYGIDIPDGVDELLPIVGEIIAGIKLLIELSLVNRDFSKVNINDKRRIQGLRAVMAISRFGVNATLALIGSVAGSPGGPIFAGLGGLGGLGIGIYINKKIKPYLHEYTLGLMGLSEDDLFYLRNKEPIDNLGNDFYNNRMSWA